MSVGMSINLGLVWEKIGLITALSSGLIAIKALIIMVLCLIFKFKAGTTIHIGLLLAQGPAYQVRVITQCVHRGENSLSKLR